MEKKEQCYNNLVSQVSMGLYNEASIAFKLMFKRNYHTPVITEVILNTSK